MRTGPTGERQTVVYVCPQEHRIAVSYTHLDVYKRQAAD